MEKKNETEAKSEREIESVTSEVEVPVVERASIEAMRIIEFFIKLEERVTRLEYAVSESSEKVTSPATIGKASINKNLENLREELKQTKLSQSRRYDAIESCLERHESCLERYEKEINSVKSQFTSLKKIANSSDSSLKTFENKFECLTKKIDTAIEKQVSQSEQIDTVIEKQISQSKQIDTIIEKQVSQSEQIDTIIEKQVSQGDQIEKLFTNMEKLYKSMEVIGNGMNNLINSHSLTIIKFGSLQEHIDILSKLLTDNLAKGSI
ncbi:hypothetical protein SteCoe_5108 [Stentor coeruleus]|uniref:Uncharacterized protein n=1 Tax=Stentor coeruleus TaxID=5963 RepID=A0A1R2CTB6_9CILI|nr:hypothetical protein SteCoe_5108 [Stentor coeruleus]